MRRWKQRPQLHSKLKLIRSALLILRQFLAYRYNIPERNLNFICSSYVERMKVEDSADFVYSDAISSQCSVLFHRHL